MTEPEDNAAPRAAPLSWKHAAQVRLVVFDVDGTLTDGGIYVGVNPDGSRLELKRFDITDGLGLKMLVWAGIEVAIVSGRVSEATASRAAELGVQECHQVEGAQKVPAVAGILERLGIGWEEVAFLGDDLPDLPALRRVGVPAAVRDAVPEVVGVAVWRGTRAGGYGAAREFSEAILRGRGVWTDLVERYCQEQNVRG